MIPAFPLRGPDSDGGCNQMGLANGVVCAHVVTRSVCNSSVHNQIGQRKQSLDGLGKGVRVKTLQPDDRERHDTALAEARTALTVYRRDEDQPALTSRAMEKPLSRQLDSSRAT